MAGIKAAASHTAALMAPDTTVDALFQQTGVLRVDDPRELLLLAAALERTQLPAGRRVAIVGNAGGLGILTADALANEDLPLAEFAPATLDALRAGSPPNSSLTNPVDLTATVDVSQMETALRAVLNDPGVDAVVVVHVLVRPGEEAQLFNMLADLTATATKPVLLIADNPSEQVEAKVAVVATPREGALVLARLAERGDWLRRSDEPDQLIPGSSIAEIRELVQVGLATDVDSEPQSPQNRWLPTTMAFEIFRMAGINVAAPIKADDADQAADVATTMGFPVCIKAANPNLMHRSDIGAVQVGLRDEFGVVCAYRAMEQTLGDAMHGVVVQPMAPPGVEIIIGIENDPHFGPIVMVGAGGRTAELWRDTAVHLAPVNKATAAEMLRSLRSHRLLTGFRNAPQADETALIDTIVRLAQLAVDVPEIAELDANPVMVHPGGVTAVDVKIRVAANANAVRDTIRMMR